MHLHRNKTGNKSQTRLLTFSSFSLKSKNLLTNFLFFFPWFWMVYNRVSRSIGQIEINKNVDFHAEELDSLKKWNAKMKFDKMSERIATSTQII